MSKQFKFFVAIVVYILTVVLLVSNSEWITDFKYSFFMPPPIEVVEEPLTVPEGFHFDSVESGAWFNENKFIVHACGGIDGVDYTNSREALDISMNNGTGIIEVDFLITSDNRLVCCHRWNHLGWDDVPTYDEFMSQPVFDRYTPLDGESIIQCMIENPELYVVIDTKDDNVQVIKALYDLCGGDTSIMDRFIVQVYERGEKAKILEIYPFNDNNFIFSIYKKYYRLNSIINICYEENIYVVAFPDYLKTKDYITELSNYGIMVYVFTVNRLDLVNKYRDYGTYGFYTDFLLGQEIGG